MSNLGFHNLYKRIASFDGIRVFRFFFEKEQDIFSPERLISSKRYSFPDSCNGLKGFDAIFFTVSFEFDYLNIIKMLCISNIPPLRNERKEKYPIVIIGGIAVSANPKPISAFSDLTFIGDMEDSLDDILFALKENRFQKSVELFKALEKIEGVFIPGKRETLIKRSIIRNIKIPSHSVIITKNTEFSGIFLIEILRGCKNSCKFCMVRGINRPPRSIDKEYIIQTVKKAIPCTRKIGLIAPVLSDHGDLAEIVNNINDFGFRISFSSLRVDHFNETIAELLVKNSQRTLTFAPEAGSFELRKSIGKNFTNKVLYDAVSIAIDYGIRHFRYYIMYGIPGEREKDIYAIVNLIKETENLFKGKNYTLHLSINPFIPKRHTLFEDEKISCYDDYIKKQKIIKNGLKGLKGVTYRFESLRLVPYHYYLSIGGENIGLLLYNCYINRSMGDFKKNAERLFLNDR